MAGSCFYESFVTGLAVHRLPDGIENVEECYSFFDIYMVQMSIKLGTRIVKLDGFVGRRLGTERGALEHTLLSFRV